MQQRREKTGLLETPDAVQRPRVSMYGLKTLLCISGNSSGVPHDRLSKLSLMATQCVRFHKLTKVANKILLPLRHIAQDIARKLTANQRKTTLYIELLRLSPLTV